LISLARGGPRGGEVVCIPERFWAGKIQTKRLFAWPFRHRPASLRCAYCTKTRTTVPPRRLAEAVPDPLSLCSSRISLLMETECRECVGDKAPPRSAFTRGLGPSNPHASMAEWALSNIANASPAVGEETQHELWRCGVRNRSRTTVSGASVCSFECSSTTRTENIYKTWPQTRAEVGDFWWWSRRCRMPGPSGQIIRPLQFQRRY